MHKRHASVAEVRSLYAWRKRARLCPRFLLVLPSLHRLALASSSSKNGDLNPMKLTDLSPQHLAVIRDAHHEAGHALACVAFAIPFSHVKLGDEHSVSGIHLLPHESDASKMVMMFSAGFVAEATLLPVDIEETMQAASEDRRAIIEILGPRGRDACHVQALLERTATFIKANAKTVSRVANALLVSRSLDQAEVHAMCPAPAALVEAAGVAS